MIEDWDNYEKHKGLILNNPDCFRTQIAKRIELELQLVGFRDRLGPPMTCSGQHSLIKFGLKDGGGYFIFDPGVVRDRHFDQYVRRVLEAGPWKFGAR